SNASQSIGPGSNGCAGRSSRGAVEALELAGVSSTSAVGMGSRLVSTGVTVVAGAADSEVTPLSPPVHETATIAAVATPATTRARRDRLAVRAPARRSKGPLTPPGYVTHPCSRLRPPQAKWAQSPPDPRPP